MLIDHVGSTRNPEAAMNPEFRLVWQEIGFDAPLVPRDTIMVPVQDKSLQNVSLVLLNNAGKYLPERNPALEVVEIAQNKVSRVLGDYLTRYFPGGSNPKRAKLEPAL